MMHQTPDFLARLVGSRRSHRTSEGETWDHCRCPVPGHGKGNGDQAGSLTVTRTPEGRVLFYCHAHCEYEDIVAALGLRSSELQSPSHNGRHGEAEAVYRYDDQGGELLFEVVRSPGKRFWQRRPGAEKGGIDGVRRVLYRL